MIGTFYSLPAAHLLEAAGLVEGTAKHDSTCGAGCCQYFSIAIPRPHSQQTYATPVAIVNLDKPAKAAELRTPEAIAARAHKVARFFLAEMVAMKAPRN